MKEITLAVILAILFAFGVHRMVESLPSWLEGVAVAACIIIAIIVVFLRFRQYEREHPSAEGASGLSWPTGYEPIVHPSSAKRFWTWFKRN